MNEYNKYINNELILMNRIWDRIEQIDELKDCLTDIIPDRSILYSFGESLDSVLKWTMGSIFSIARGRIWFPEETTLEQAQALKQASQIVIDEYFKWIEEQKEGQTKWMDHTK